MAQRTLTINLPRSPKRLHDLIAFLVKQDILSEKEAHTIEQPKKPKVTPKKKSRWALAAQRLRREKNAKKRHLVANDRQEGGYIL